MPKIKTSKPITVPTRQSPRAKKAASYKDTASDSADTEDETPKSKKARMMLNNKKDANEILDLTESSDDEVQEVKSYKPPVPKGAKRAKPEVTPPSVSTLMARAMANHQAEEENKKRQQAVRDFLNRPSQGEIQRLYYQRMQAEAAQKQAYLNQINAAMNVTYLATQPSLNNIVDLTGSPPNKGASGPRPVSITKAVSIAKPAESQNKPSTETSVKPTNGKSAEASEKTNSEASGSKPQSRQSSSESEEDDEESKKMILKFETGYKCTQCLRLYQSKTDLKRHIIKVHTDARRFKCAKCGDVFNKQDDLDKHEMTHGRDKSYVCVKCEMGFYSLETLKRHEKIHEKKKDYECAECGRIYHEMNKLVLHSAVHRKSELPFQCEECDEGFRARGNLKMHIKMVHSGRGKRRR